MPANIIEDFQTNTGAATQYTPFDQRFNDLKAKKINKDKEFDPQTPNAAMVRLLRRSKAGFKAYVESSGANTDFATTQEELDKELDNYDSNVLLPLVQLRRDIIASTDINQKMGELTKANQDLEQKKRDLQVQQDNYTTAQVRNTALNTHGEAISYHQAWGLIQRPIKRQSIPVLLVFTLLFIYIGSLGIYYISPLPSLIATAGPMSIPSMGVGSAGGTGGAIMEFISGIMQSPVAVSIVISAAIILAIILIMKLMKRV